jgi:hypothetical protein
VGTHGYPCLSHREKDKLKRDLKGGKERMKDLKRTLKEADDSSEILKRETKAAIGSEHIMSQKLAH